MKNNKERVLEYLSGLMTNGERDYFERDIKSSKELNELFQKYSKNLSSIKELSEASVDERYFATLIPKVRSKVSSSKRRSFVYRLAPILPAIILTVFIAVNILYFDLSTTSSFEKLIRETIADSDSGTIAEIAAEYSSYFYEDYSVDLELNDNYFDESNISANELADQINLSFIDSYMLYENLSEEDIDNIYNSLIDKKIL